MIEALVEQLKTQALSSLEQNVYDQAVTQDLADSALRALVEGAIDQLQLKAPGAMGGLGAVVGLLGSLGSQLGSLGLAEQARSLLAQYQVDQALRDAVLRGLTRYLEENGARLMQVAVDAAIQKLTRAGS
ncbi:MAG: hypothetical protein MUF64_18390 [Polyangiaceae bacterium]|jgi:hypothetical protein|nr:hypothetical protein [Polyangiaceae bacterium]